MPRTDQDPEYINFYEEVPAADEPDPTGEEPALEEGDEPAEEREDEEPVDDTGDEPDDEGEGDEDEGGEEPAKKDPRNQHVPFKRYQKTRNELKAAQAEIERFKAQTQKPADDGEDDEPKLDDRSKAAVEKYMRDNGYVKREDLERDKRLAEAHKRVEADKTELTKWGEEQGFPKFDAVEVDKWAEKNLGKGFVKNKATLKAAYMARYEEEIAEVQRKRAIADTRGGGTPAERPGAGARTEPGGGEEDTSIKGRILSGLREITTPNN